MKLNKGYSLFRYEIAQVLNMNDKKLYRFLKKNEIKVSSGMVPPCDLDRIEAVYYGEKNIQEHLNEDIKPENIPQRS